MARYADTRAASSAHTFRSTRRKVQTWLNSGWAQDRQITELRDELQQALDEIVRHITEEQP